MVIMLGSRLYAEVGTTTGSAWAATADPGSFAW